MHRFIFSFHIFEDWVVEDDGLQFSSMAQQSLVGQGLLIILASQSHSDTLGVTPLDESSALRGDLYLPTHSTQKWDIHALGGIEISIPVSVRP